MANEAENIFKTFDFTEEDGDYVTVIEKLDTYFIQKKKNMIQESFHHQKPR